ncbi:MAG TPA: MFS transporter [Bryobacteraceae bacterium]|nr:MFS transporter [Bryobacteraceae bacterium]
MATSEPDIVPTGGSGEASNHRELLYAAIVVFVGITAVTVSQQNAIALIPLKNLLKNELHQDRAATAAFFFWIGLAWYFKPFFGIFTDAFPFFGTRRKSYILTGSILSVVSFIVLAYTPHRYAALLVVSIAVNVFMVVTSCAVGGFMTEKAQALKASGRFSSVFQIAYQMAGVIGGPLGGVLAAVAFGWTNAASAAIMFLPIPAVIFFLKEQRTKIDSKRLLGEAKKQLAKTATAKTMWAAAGFSFLFYFAPGIQTALFYQQQDVLHMSTQTQGIMLFLNGIFGIASAAIYGTFACKRWTLRKLLFWSITIGAIAQMTYGFYSSVERAYLIESFWGLGWSAADMALTDLYMRATPGGSEGLGFSLMVSVRNLALFGADWIGSKAMDTYHFHFSTMAVANGAISLIALPFLFLLPGLIVDRKDTGIQEEGILPETATKADS